MQKHLQYRIINDNNIIIGVPIVENNLISVDGQKVGGPDQDFIKVLFMLNTYTCFISGILLARYCKLSSIRLEMFRICMRLKLIILE